MANFLSNLFSAGASSLVEAVGTAIDKTFTSDDERKALENEISKATMQYEIEMANISLKEKQSYLDDITSARVEQSRVQESEHASWLAKNVQPVLAIGILGLTFFMYWYIVFSDDSVKILANDSVMKDIVIYILGALTTVATQVVSYFFGSSSGSADKSKTLNAMAKGK
ncbi:MAG: hypothetical protein C0403_12555 [Desulfobacterium sp.]|nr:hypothetical protein [Desulfobacterium sp.]